MRLIIDTDAGVDDAQALLLALAYQNTRIEAITTVTGNIHVDYVTRNVATTLKVMEREQIPIYRGADRPLVSEWTHQTAFIHGNDGLGDWADRPVSQKTAEPEHAALAMIRLAAQYPHEITLVALGPMTNIALAVRLDPEFPSRIKQLVWMGGAVSGFGNTEVFTAEFNAQVDPEAAYIALHAFPNSIMIPWETSVRHAIAWERVNTLLDVAQHSKHPIARFFLGITAFTIATSRQVPGLHGLIVPDPITMAATLVPDIVTATQHRYVTVELSGSNTRGMTPADFTYMSPRQPNTHIVTTIDQGEFEALMSKLLTKGAL